MKKYIWEVRVDGETYLSDENIEAQDLSDVKIYMAKGTNIADGVIENFLYEESDSPSIGFIG